MENRSQQTQNVLRLVECGLLIAIGIILDTFFKFEAIWAYGGSVTLFAMLPLVIIAYKYGVFWGALSGVAHGIITMLISGLRSGGLAVMVRDNGGWKVFIWVMLLDYILAFAVIGIGGLAAKWAKTPSGALMAGAVIGLTLRYLVHILSGALLFGSYASWFFTDVITAQWGQDILNSFSGGMLSFLYSVIYNGLYMVPEIIITVIGGGLAGRFLKKQLLNGKTN